MKDILTAQKAEVIQVVLETFDQEKYEKAMKQATALAARKDSVS